MITLSSNLDHGIATNNLVLNDLGHGHKVRVRGWVDAQADEERHTLHIV